MATLYRPLLKTQVIPSALLALVLFCSSAYAAGTYDGVAIGQLETITTNYEDTLVDLAKQHEVGYAQLLAANPGVDPWVPNGDKGTSRKLILPNWHILPDVEHKGLVLNTGELRLYYFPPDGSPPKTFPIGIGREGLNTPKGSTTIVNKVANPVWRPTPRMRLEDPELPAEVKSGPDNPLGAYALYLGWPSYRIHGTNKPKAIGRRASSGCIRMYDDHIDWLFHTVPVGTKVTSVNQPVKMAWIGDAFYIEAEPNDLQVDELEYQNRQITIDIPDGMVEEVKRKAGSRVGQIDWKKVRNVLVERTGIPTKVSFGSDDVSPVMKEASAKPVAKSDDASPVFKKPASEDAAMDKVISKYAEDKKPGETSLAQGIQKAAKETREKEKAAVPVEDHRNDWKDLNH